MESCTDAALPSGIDDSGTDAPPPPQVLLQSARIGAAPLSEAQAQGRS
jgi:hypothetical protein